MERDIESDTIIIMKTRIVLISLLLLSFFIIYAGSLFNYTPGHALTENEKEEIKILVKNLTSKQITKMESRVEINSKGLEEVEIVFEPEYVEENNFVYRIDQSMIVFHQDRLGENLSLKNHFLSKKTFEIGKWFYCTDPIITGGRYWHFFIDKNQVDISPVKNLSYSDAKEILFSIAASSYQKGTDDLDFCIENYLDRIYGIEYKKEDQRLKLYIKDEAGKNIGMFFEFHYNKENKILIFMAYGWWGVV
jgi:hypothetical protein